MGGGCLSSGKPKNVERAGLGLWSRDSLGEFAFIVRQRPHGEVLYSRQAAGRSPRPGLALSSAGPQQAQASPGRWGHGASPARPPHRHLTHMAALRVAGGPRCGGEI